jgi:hypothetical protein
LDNAKTALPTSPQPLLLLFNTKLKTIQPDLMLDHLAVVEVKEGEEKGEEENETEA